MTTINAGTYRRHAVLPLTAAIALATGVAVSLGAGSKQPGTAEPPSASIAFADSLSNAFRSATGAISPSVVNITTVDKPDVAPALNRGQQPGQSMPPGAEELFRRFFGEGGGMPPGAQPMPMPERRGQGSGVIIREDGYILTNNHVVDGADEVMVRFDDGREYAASVIGNDPESDLAVIRVDADGLPAARIGDSDQLQPGDWVVAVGNPFGLDHTVTAGVVSAKGRGELGLSTYEDFIQTDAAINPGNSGGPLINLHGEVVGINSAIRSSSGGSIGIGFAIPSNLAMHVADSLIDDGRVARGWLGVSIQPLTSELASSFGHEDTHGALVSDVVSDTPAAKAGLEAGDIITRVDHRVVSSPRELVNTIAEHEPGERVSVTVERGGSTRTLDVTLGERPGQAELAMSAPAADAGGGTLGLRVQPMTAELAEQLGVSGTTGLIVTEVQPGSLAAEAGLRPEDIILEAGRQPVTSAAELSAAARNADKGLLLKISRQGRALFIVLKKAD